MGFITIDVSNVNGPIDWAKVVAHAKAARINLQAAGVKASEGRTFNDRLELANVTGARKHGLRVFLYHYALPHLNTPGEEAAHLLVRLEQVGLHARDIRPFLDLEDPAALGMGHKLDAWARGFNKVIRDTVGVWPGFYSYGDFLNHVRPSTPIGAALWYAAYGRNDGVEHPVAVPRPWRRIQLHQFASVSRWPGIHGDVDISHGVSLLPLLAHPARNLIAGPGGGHAPATV